MATGAAALVSALERAGVRVVFGVAGPHNIELATAFRQQGARLIGVQHAESAVAAADGYSRRSAKVGAVLAGPGSDIRSLYAPLYEAFESNTPLLVISLDPAGHPARPRSGRSAIDETPDHTPLVGRVLRGVTVLQSVDTLTTDVRAACEMANGRPAGPVLLHVRHSLLSGESELEPVEEAEPAEPPPAAPAKVEHVQLRRAGNLVDSSAKVLIWAGGGAMRSGAGGAVAELAEKVGAPVLLTNQAAGLLPARHPCLVGLPPHLPAIGSLWDDAELVIAIGTDFDAYSTQGWAQPDPNALISINLDAAEAGRHYRPDVLLRGDARTLTKALVDAVSYRGGTAVVRSRLDEVRTAARRSLEAAHADELAFLSAVGAALPDRATVVADQSTAGRWLASFHEWTLPRTLLMTGADDRFGFALPAALGAAATGSAEPVVAITGDQNLLMRLGELAAVAKEALAMTIVVVDDGGAGRLRPLLEERDLPLDMFDRPTPDFAATARTFGLRADVIETVDEELTGALRAHIAAPDPTLLVIRAKLAPPPTARHRWYRVPASASG